MDNDNDNAVTLQSICQDITLERAKEVLEAASGNLERAIDIFFFQQQQEQEEQVVSHIVDHADGEQVTPLSVKSPTTGRVGRSPAPVASTKPSPKKKPRQSQLDFGRKQPRLDTHFGFQSSQQQKGSSTGTDDQIDCSQSIDDAIVNLEPLSQPVTEIIDIDDDNNDSDQSPSPCSQEEKEELPTPQFDEVIMKVSSVLQSEYPESTEISFQRLAETLQQLTDTTKRLVKLDVLKDFILHIQKQQQQQSQDQIRSQAKTLTCGLHLILGFHGDQPLEVGGSAMTKALQTILGASRMQLSKAYRQYGDLGDAAASLFQKKSYFVSASSQSKSLTVLQVYETFQKIITTDGRDAKQNILLQLLRACNTKTEIRFLVRLLIGNMRVGANLKTILAALAMAFVPDNNSKQAIEIIQKTHDICPNLEAIITALLEGGLEQVQRDCQIQLMTPIAPMLAHPIHSLEQVAKIMTDDHGQSQPMTMEWKYDGVRCQAHCDGTSMKLFSRHMLETTSQYPDAAQAIFDARRNQELVTSFIIDAEIVGVEGEGPDYRLLPFQDLSRRKKKNDNGQGVRVKVFCFDLMYLNGISYIRESLAVRQAKMREIFVETLDFAHVSSQLLPSYDEPSICSFLEQAVEKGAEGLMLKLLGSLTIHDEPKSKNKAQAMPDDGDQEPRNSTTGTSSPYEAGTRSHSWLKVKRDYVAGYADTIDVVPIGAWYGHGRKAQKSFLSPVLLAVYDDEEEVYRSICRCMSFTDAMYDAMREFYFRGTPYPEQVGMEKVTPPPPSSDPTMDTTTTVDNSSLTVIQESVKNDGIEDNEEKDDDDNDDGSSEDENEMDDADVMTSMNDGMDDASVMTSNMVNCFSSRPSSAYIVTNESPPIWFRPMEVFEVSFADMSLSKQHSAAAGLLPLDEEQDRGVALCFPRFKRRRPDEKPEQATTSRQIAQLFLQQSKQASNTNQQRREQAT